MAQTTFGDFRSMHAWLQNVPVSTDGGKTVIVEGEGVELAALANNAYELARELRDQDIPVFRQVVTQLDQLQGSPNTVAQRVSRCVNFVCCPCFFLCGSNAFSTIEHLKLQRFGQMTEEEQNS